MLSLDMQNGRNTGGKFSDGDAGRADLARCYYAYLVTGVTPAARKLPDLKVVA